MPDFKKERTTHWIKLALAALVSSTMLACTTGKKSDDMGAVTEQPTQRLDLDPMLIQASADGEDATSLNADEVFQEAYRAYAGRRYEEALTHYATIIKYFPDSRFFLPSLFNAGLANEKLERWENAAAHYRTILERYPTRKDAKDAYFRLAEVYEKLGEWQQASQLMTEVMLRPDLEHFDRMEAHVRRSGALIELGQYVEAEDGFRTMLQLNREAAPTQRLEETAEFIVRAEFGLGRALHLQVMQIPLVLPTEKMGEDLEVKAKLFIRSQAAYIRALRVHHPQWSVAAGFMIGRLYEDFYLDILSAEIPSELSEEQVALYFEELRKQLRPLMVRAIQVYEKNLSLAKRIPGAANRTNEWANATDVHLTRLKAYLDDPFTQKRAERLVIQGRPLDQLWDPQLMAIDVVDEAIENAREENKKRKPKS